LNIYFCQLTHSFLSAKAFSSLYSLLHLVNMPLELPVWRALANKTVVLASASPRRREILQAMVSCLHPFSFLSFCYLSLLPLQKKKGLQDFKVVPTLEPDENNPAAYDTKAAYVSDTAWMKAKEVWDRCQSDASLPKADVVIGADTVVVFNDTVLEKPKDAAHAVTMLRQLSGHTHTALTGVHILAQDLHYQFVTTTKVTFATLTEDDIQECK
jgi:septum formation protein